MEANIPLCELHRVFTATDIFTHQYYLPLPRSHRVTMTPAPSLPPAPNRSQLPPPTTRLVLNPFHTPFPVAPIWVSIRSTSSTTVGGIAILSAAGKNLNESWDLSDVMKHNPKMVTMMQCFNKSNRKSVN